MLKEILEQSIKLDASDVHLSAGYTPFVRVCGELKPLKYKIVQEKDLQDLINCNLANEYLQKLNMYGEVDCSLTFNNHRYRLNVYKQNFGYSLAIRILNEKIPDYSQLGIPDSILNLALKETGLILVTGATGSGKSTTLAALVEFINQRRAVHIITLEEPIEYCYQSKKAFIHQREVGVDTKSFASGLRSALREDPDVILIGELRDEATMLTALSAAETGHLVLATLHTLSVINSIDRILDILKHKEEIKSQLAGCLLSIIGQQLLVKKDKTGRVAAFETLIVTSAVRNLIREGKLHQLYSYMQTGSRFGMITMADAINNLKEKGLI